ncbi:hypothetical protein F2X77_09640 [Staphylococcus aureus]|nr:hypothetical protein [Staphylococcus aureus]QER28467.1 hypothetical protein F2X77_09640 [Staphylococcus aureus]HAR7189727.1 hypothetical protein [Staphylococcus aureus]
MPIFYVTITCVYSRSELYSPAEAIYLAVGLTGDIFLVITRYIFALQLRRFFMLLGTNYFKSKIRDTKEILSNLLSKIYFHDTF